MNTLNINMPVEVEFILSTLLNNGFDSYIVGGCVRDSIMKNTPNDWDICTAALPDEVKNIFKLYRVIDTGTKHGTVTLIINNNSYEITTFRYEDDYSDNRHPNNVVFVKSIYEDLTRRDFTINAIAYNNQVGIVDPFNGIQDINNKVIRCVGKAKDRFNEDALRILRAIRFSVKLNFKIDLVETLPAMLSSIHLLKNISSERINSELVKTLKFGYSELLNVCLFNSGWLDYRFNESELLYKNSNEISILTKIVSLLNNYDSSEKVDWLKRLRFDNKFINKFKSVASTYEYVNKSCKSYENFSPLFWRIISRNVYLSCEDNYDDLMNLYNYSDDIVDTIIYNKLKLNKDQSEYCHNISMLNITGDDLKSIGFRDKQIGDVLNRLLFDVMHENIENSYKCLMDMSRRWFDQSFQ